MSHSVTIYVAGAGAHYNNEDGSYGGRSYTGHMWFSLNDDTTGMKSCYGFHPSIEKSMHTDIGEVKTNDNQTYPSPDYTTTFYITDEQYEKLTEYCQRTKQDHTFGPYYGIGNSCVNYTMNVMGSIGYGGGMALPIPEANIGMLDAATRCFNRKMELAGYGAGQGGGVELDDIMVLRKLSESMEKQHGKENPAAQEMREKYRQALAKEFPMLSPERRESAFDEAWSKGRPEAATAKIEPKATKERGFDFYSALAQHLQSNNELHAQIDSQRGVQNQQRTAPTVQDASGLTR